MRMRLLFLIVLMCSNYAFGSIISSYDEIKSCQCSINSSFDNGCSCPISCYNDRGKGCHVYTHRIINYCDNWNKMLSELNQTLNDTILKPINKICSSGSHIKP